MSSVDERVVSMKFDNKQFVSGIKTTLTYLEELKSALNFKSNNKFSASLDELSKKASKLKTDFNLTSVKKNVNDLGTAAENTKKKFDFSSVKSKFNDLGTAIDNAKSKFDFSGVISKFTSLGNKASEVSKKMKFDDSVNSLSEVQRAAGKIDFTPVSDAIEGVKNRFNSLGIVGITVMQNLTNSVLGLGQTILSALSFSPIVDGFHEYETQMNAVQTILANTSTKGTTLQQVNDALDLLNTYADKTIYNFTEMTRNIGTFTAAGVDLQTSVDSIQGIANLAAVSGSSSMQASVAMYQLSQAIAAGTVKLMDWNSVVNAGMGGEVFQNALIRTSEHLQTGAKAAIEAEGSFRESLSTGWLTTQVLTETLSQFAMSLDTAEDYDRAIQQLVDSGYTEEEAKAIADMARTAMDAATKVKTFSQLLDTLKEALGSGWAQSWRTIIGDFGEAKELWTQVSDVLSNAINESANARNEILDKGLKTGWQQLLGQGITDADGYIAKVKEVASEHDVAIDDIISQTGSFENSLKEGWASSDILSDALHRLADETRGLSDAEIKAKGYTRAQINQLQEFDEAVQNGSVDLNEYISIFGRMSGRRNIIEGLSNAFDSLAKITGAVKEAFREVFPRMTGEQLYELTDKFKKLTERMKVTDDTLDKLKRTFKGLFSILDTIKQLIGSVTKPFGEFLASDDVSTFGSNVLNAAANLGDFLVALNESVKAGDSFNFISKSISKVLSLVGSAFKSVNVDLSKFTEFISNAANFLKNTLGDAIGGVAEFAEQNISLNDILTFLTTGGILSIASNFDKATESITKFLKKLTGDVASPGLIDTLKKSLTSFFKELGVALQSFTFMVNTVSLSAIALSITLLVHSIKQLTELNFGSVVSNLPVLAVTMAILVKGFNAFVKTLKDYNAKNTIAAAASMVLMAKAIKMCADAIKTLSDINLDRLIPGLAGLYATLKMISSFMSKTPLDKGALKNAAVLVALGISLKIVASALKDLSSMGWEELGRGLAGMGVALLELGIVVTALSKKTFNDGAAIQSAVAILILCASLKLVASALKDLGAMANEDFGKGLVGMTVALIELTAVASVLSKFSNVNGIAGAAAVLILCVSLNLIAVALQGMGKLDGDQMKSALFAMSLALAELMIVAIALSAFTNVNAIVGAASVLIIALALLPIAKVLQELGQMSMDQIDVALNAMARALITVGGIAAIMGAVGPSTIVGAASMLIASFSLQNVVNALQQLSQFSQDQVDSAINALSRSLIVVGGIAAIMGAVGPATIVGAASMLIASFSLQNVANALQQFASMSWDEIDRGLEAMMSALEIIAVGSFINTLSAIGGASIGVAADSLYKLADAMRNWEGVTIPDGIREGLDALADGVGYFTWDALAGASMGTAVGPLGEMADSVKKWDDVHVPDTLREELSALADGVGCFTWTGFGADAISTVAQPLGTLAYSVKQWKDVTLPGDLQQNLKALAKGVGEFQFSGFSAGGMREIAEPLGNLAGQVNRWNNVKIPDDIQTGLTDIAMGVASFTSAIAGVDIMRNSIDPLKNIINDVLKPMESLRFRTGIKDQLSDLAYGVSSFAISAAGAAVLPQVGDPLKSLSEAIVNISGVEWPQDLYVHMNSLAQGLKSFEGAGTGIGEMNGAGEAMSSIANGVNALLGVNLDAAGTGLSNFANTIADIPAKITMAATSVGDALTNLTQAVALQGGALSGAFTSLMQQSLNAVESQAGLFSTAGTNVVNALSMAVDSGIQIGGSATQQALVTMAMSIIDAGINQLQGSIDKFRTSGQMMMDGLKSGLQNGLSGAIAVCRSAGSQCANAVQGDYGQFYNAGLNMMRGLQNGITAGRSGVIAAAVDTASEALAATKRALDEHSPSKATYEMGKFYDMGLINGMESMRDKIQKLSSDIGYDALNGMQKTIDNVDFSSLSATPTITPVVNGNDLNLLNGLRASQSVMLNAKFANMQVVDPINSLRDSIIKDNMEVIKSNNQVLDSINGLRNDMSSYNDSISNMETNMYVDGKKLAASIAKPMNRELGTLSKRGRL